MNQPSLNALPVKYHLLDSIVDEIHSRSFPRIQGSVILSQVTLLHSEEGRESQLDHLTKLAHMYHAAPPIKMEPSTGIAVEPGTSSEVSCYYQDLGEIDVRWEYHTEFSTYTFIRLNSNEAPFSCTPWQILPKSWRRNIPGKLISATHLDIQQRVPDYSVLQQLFAGHPVATSLVADQKAQLMSSFKTTDSGFDHILVIDQGMTQAQKGWLLRCLLELSSYRIMSLLSLPVSKRLLPNITQMEKELANVTLSISDPASQAQNPKEMLDKLSGLSARLESLIADNQFRFDASMAYFDIVSNRLTELKETEVSAGPSFSDFLLRRLAPAVKTGNSILQRMHNMSTRIEKASDLLRTKINLGLEEQNQDLLKALNRRSHIQLRLQQLVESVSMIAISYYIIQILSYMLVIPAQWNEHISKAQIIAASVPLVLGSVWYVLHKLKKRWRKEKVIE